MAGVELKTGKNELVEPDPIRRSATKRAIGEADKNIKNSSKFGPN